jgi:hypothetical protein
VLTANGPVGQVKASPKIVLVYIPSSSGRTQHFSCSCAAHGCYNIAQSLHVQLKCMPLLTRVTAAHMAVAQCSLVHSKAVSGPGADKLWKTWEVCHTHTYRVSTFTGTIYFILGIEQSSQHMYKTIMNCNCHWNVKYQYQYHIFSVQHEHQFEGLWDFKFSRWRV